MRVYPYTQPVVLTDDIFVSYGGVTGTSTPGQREIAYFIAEVKVSEYFNALLTGTIITGTSSYQPYDSFISTEWGYVTQINRMAVENKFGSELHVITGTSSYAIISDDTYGYLLVRDLLATCKNCGDASLDAYKFKYVYTSGLPFINDVVYRALVIIAQVNLNELYFPSRNESIGDIGITEFRALDYSEKRKMWKATALGDSPATAQAAKLLDASGFKLARKGLALR